MKRKKRIFMSLVLSMSLVIFYSTSAFAYNTFNNHTRSFGVNPMRYDFDSSANNYSGAIFDGAIAWNDSSSAASLYYSPGEADLYFTADTFADASTGIMGYGNDSCKKDLLEYYN